MVTWAHVEPDDKTRYCDNPYEHGCGRQPAPILCIDCGRRVAKPCDEEAVSGLCLRCLNGGPPALADSCCGKCPGATCYVDQITGA